MIDRYKIHNEDSFNYLKEIPDNKALHLTPKSSAQVSLCV